MMLIGVVQLGVVAACVVLLVPMGMAGWHLSRNKMLFFSCALFISLAVCVHLTPYFPNLSTFVASVSSVVVFDNRISCINSVNEIVWDVRPRTHRLHIEHNNATVTSLDLYQKNWDWARTSKVGACDFQRLDGSDASDLLNGSWVVVAGDSQARLTALSLLNLLLGSDSARMDLVRIDLFKRHSDYKLVVDEIGLKLDYIWAPYVTNLTHMTTEFRQNKTYPDVLVMGAGLWHMLHVTNASDYALSLEILRSSLLSLFPFAPETGTAASLTGSVSIRSPHLFWLGMPMLINSMLNTEEKREKMNDGTWHGYDRALGDSRLLRQTGGPLVLLDIESLTWNCGPRCTADGMHYDDAVYEASIQVMLNTLLIESHQKI